MPLARARWKGNSTTISTLEPPGASFTFNLALNMEPSAEPERVEGLKSALYLESNFRRSRSLLKRSEIFLKLSSALKLHCFSILTDGIWGEDNAYPEDLHGLFKDSEKNPLLW